MIASVTRWAILCALASALLITVATPAGGHIVERSDPNDVAGLDIKEVGYRHADGRTYVALVFYGYVRAGQLNNGQSVAYWLYTTGDDAEVDWVVEFRYGSDPATYFCSILNAEFQQVRTVPAVKRDKSLRCNFKSSVVDGVAERFKAITFTDDPVDVAPNGGLYRHNSN